MNKFFMFKKLQNYKLQAKNGLTIIEVSVAVGIFAIIIVVLMDFVIQNYKSWNEIMRIVEAQRNGQKAIQVMIKELRNIAEMSETGTFPLESAQNQSIIFYSDIDSDSQIEKVRYFIQDNKFKKGVIPPTGDPIEYKTANETISDIAEYIANGNDSVFYYYDKNYIGTGEPLANPVDITKAKLIKIFLRVNVDPNKPPSDFILESQVNLRNLKENY